MTLFGAAADPDSESDLAILLFDDFLGAGEYWKQDSGNKIGTDSTNPPHHWERANGWALRDGYLFLNISQNKSKLALAHLSPRGYGDGESWEEAVMIGDGKDGWIPFPIKNVTNVKEAVLKVRLRCSDDRNEGASKSWGLWNGMMQLNGARAGSGLWFVSNPGFSARIWTNNQEEKLGIVDMDVREWHDYTIIWREDNSTFLINGEIVASFNQPPSAPMHVDVTISSNLFEYFSCDHYGPRMSAVYSESLQIDYIRLSVKNIPEHILLPPLSILSFIPVSYTHLTLPTN